MLRALVVVALLLVPALTKAQDTAVRRFALVVGVSSGGPSRTPLRYATSDAESFAQLLSALGGVALADRMILMNPDRTQFDTAVAEMQSRMMSRGDASRVELIVYFSGHSDENGLMLGSDQLSYPSFRAALATLPADVRIAIVDSCQSGALTRRKGGTMRPPFLLDTSTKVHGQAILTSSSETEAAQESDRIRGSFFTHYLITGLRGAADVTNDRRVTLNEAYQFAFAETLARTEGTQYGAQHPAYEIALSGTGDVVMTDLRATSASLTIESSLAGRVFLRDTNDRLVAELFKVEGRTVEIGLPPGKYRVRVEKAGEVLEGAVEVGEHASVKLARSGLERRALEVAMRRGDAGDEPELAAETVVVEAPKRRVVRPFSFGIIPGLELPPRPDDAEVVKYLSYDVAYGSTEYIRGFALSTGASRATRSMHGMQLSTILNTSDGEATGMQMTVLANVVRGPFAGFQISGAVQRNHDVTKGLQLAGGANWNSGNLDGLAVAGGANLAYDMRGVQIAGGMNRARDTHGVQLAGLNVADQMTGMQLALLNVANDTTGLQLALINVGGDIHGVQFGLINVAQAVYGAQVGLINVSKDMYGAPIGLFSYIRNRGLGLDVGVSLGEPVNLALRFDGGHRFYGLLGGGLFDFGNFTNGSAYLGAGLGVRLFEIKGVTVELEALAATPTLKIDTSDFLVRQRLQAVFPLDKDLAFFAGVSWFEYMGWNDRDNLVAQGNNWSSVHKSGDFTLRSWVTLHGGIRI